LSQQKNLIQEYSKTNIMQILEIVVKLTPCDRVHCENLNVAQLVKKCLDVYGT
jgi:hypothetical protein